MKLAIVSDLHIGYERFEEDAYKQAREALFAAAEESDAILIAGDVFDKRSPKPEVIAQAINIFRDISRRDWRARVKNLHGNNSEMHTDVPIIAIPGTHERVAEGRDNVLKLLALAGLIVDASESTAIIELDGEKVAVFGLGGVSEERVKEVLARVQPKPVDGAFNIFMMHQSIYELLPFSEETIRYEELPEGFDLYINGHIHSRVEATVHGKKFLIPGSTVLTQLKDNEQEPKGFILFDTTNYTHVFRPINSRRFVSLSLHVDDAIPKRITDACEALAQRTLGEHNNNPIIRIRLDGTIARGFTNADMQLRSLITRYSHIATIEVDSSRLKNPDTGKEIGELRDGMVGGESIKELGMRTFASKLKENKFDESIDAQKLFEILGSELSKEKKIRAATELLEGS